MALVVVRAMFFLVSWTGVYLLLASTFLTQSSGLPLRAAELETFESLYDQKLAEFPQVQYSGSTQDLLDHLTDLIKLDPKRSEGYIERAKIYNAIHQYDREIDDLSMALMLEPQDLDLLKARISTNEFLYGVARDNSKHWGGYPEHPADVYGEAVIRDRNRLAVLLPEDAHNVYERGSVKILMGDLNGGIDDFNHVIDLFPFPAAYTSRAAAKEQLGDLQGALHDYVTLLAEAPEELYYYLHIQRIHFLLGDLKSACHLYNQALDRFGNYVQGYPDLILVNPDDCSAR